MGGQIPCQRKALRQMEEAPLFWGASNLMRGGGWRGRNIASALAVGEGASGLMRKHSLRQSDETPI